MSLGRPSKRPVTDRVSGREMADALADVLKDQTKKGEERGEAPPSRGRKTSPAVRIALIIFSVLSGYVWFGSPSWLAYAPPGIPEALAEAGLRMEVFQQAVLVEEFLEDEDRLPNDLAEAGDPFTEVEYHKIDAQTFRLASSAGGQAVEYLSTESLEVFLGDAPQIIRGGG